MKKLISVLSLALVSQMAFAAQECSVDFLNLHLTHDTRTLMLVL